MKEIFDDRINYDERQIIARGFAFKYAYLTVLIIGIILWLLDEFVLSVRVPTQLMFSIPLWISMVVLYYYTIMKDAFEGLRSFAGLRLIAFLMGIAGILLVVSTLYDLISGQKHLTEDGFISITAGSLVSGLSMLVIMTTYLCYRRRQRRERAEE